MKISYITLSEKRCTVQFYGCNFKCKGCFTACKLRKCKEIKPKDLASKLKEFNIEEIMLAGGEPTLYKNDLFDFIKLCDFKVTLSTNGYLLDADYIKELEKCGLNEIHIDLKAYSKALHEWYTEKSNETVLKSIEQLNKSSIDLEVITVLIPEVIGIEEIQKIAEFLSRFDEIRYRIIRYIPVDNLSRRPTEEEINKAVSTAKKYLGNVTSSLEWRRHPKTRKVVLLD